MSFGYEASTTIHTVFLFDVVTENKYIANFRNNGIYVGARFKSRSPQYHYY